MAPTRPTDPLPIPAGLDHSTNAPLMLGVEISIAATTVLVVLTRFYTRTIIKSLIGVDDWIMGVALCFAVAITFLQCYGTHFGTGKHMWDVDFSKAFTAVKFAWVTNVLFPTCASLTKLSICVTYLRILPFKVDRMFCYGTIVYLICYCIATTFMTLFNCHPIKAFWDPFVKGDCIPLRIVLIIPAALNSLTDIIVYLWPARTLFKVKQPPLQRFGLIFVFVVGSIVCVAGICRIWYITKFASGNDIFYEAAILYTITCIELNVGIIFGCLPALKPLLARVFPSIFGSTPGIARRFREDNNWTYGSVRLHTPATEPKPAGGAEGVPPLGDISLSHIQAPAPVAKRTDRAVTAAKT